MGEGATRVGEANGGAARVSELDDEITDVRHRLDSLVVELDRRRHNATDWKRQLRLHWGSILIGAIAFSAALAAPVALSRRRGWRHRFLGVQPDVLRKRAFGLTQALVQARRPAERREAPVKLGVGGSTVVGLLVMLAQVAATTWMRNALERRRV